MKLSVNGSSYDADVDGDTPLLWALRDALDLTGAKYGCGIAQCGACTVHIDGQAVRSCQATVAMAEGREITTIEGLGSIDDPHPVQAAWIEKQVAQCGYCQSGQMMQAAWLLEVNPDPSDEDIDRAMGGNLCRCGTYPLIREAVKLAARNIRGA